MKNIRNIFNISPWRENRLCYSAENGGDKWAGITSKSQEIEKVERKLMSERPDEARSINFSNDINRQLSISKTQIDTLRIHESFKNTARVSILNEMREFFDTLVKEKSGDGANVSITQLKENARNAWREAKADLLRDIGQIESEAKSVESLSRLRERGESPTQASATSARNTERNRRESWNRIDQETHETKRNFEATHLRPAESAVRNLQFKNSGFMDALPRGPGDTRYICTRDVIASAQNARRWFEGGGSGNFAETKTRNGSNFYIYTIQRAEEEKSLHAYPLISQYASISVALGAIAQKTGEITDTQSQKNELTAQLTREETALKNQQLILKLQIESALANTDWQSPAHIEREQARRDREISQANTELINANITELRSRLQAFPAEAQRTPAQKKEVFFLEVQILALRLQNKEPVNLNEKISEASSLNPPFVETRSTLDGDLTVEQKNELRIQSLLEYAKREYQKASTHAEDQDKLTAINSAIDSCLKLDESGNISSDFNNADSAFIAEPKNISQLSLNFSLLQGIQEKIGSTRKQISFMVANVSKEIENAKKALDSSSTGEMFTAWLESWNPWGDSKSGLTPKQKEIKDKVDTLKLKLENMVRSASRLKEASQKIQEKGTSLKDQRGKLAEKKESDAGRIELTKAHVTIEYARNKETLEKQRRQAELQADDQRTAVDTTEQRRIAALTEAESSAIERSEQIENQMRTRDRLQNEAQSNVEQHIRARIENEMRRQHPTLTNEALNTQVTNATKSALERLNLEETFDQMRHERTKSFSNATALLADQLANLRTKKLEQEIYFQQMRMGLEDSLREMTGHLLEMQGRLDTDFANQLEALNLLQIQTQDEALQLRELSVPMEEFTSHIDLQTNTIELDVKAEIKGALEQDVKGPAILSDVIGLKHVFNAVDSWTRDGILGGIRSIGGTVLSKVGTFIGEELIGDFPNSWIKAMTLGLVDPGWSSLSQNWEQTIQTLRKADLGVFTFAPELLAGAMGGIRGLGTMVVDIIKNPASLVTGLVHIVEHPAEFIDQTLQISSILEGVGIKKNQSNELFGLQSKNLGAALGEGAFNALTFAAMGGAKPMKAYKNAYNSLTAAGYSPAMATAIAGLKATAAVLKPTVTVPLHAIKGLYGLGKFTAKLPEGLIRQVAHRFNSTIATKATLTDAFFKGVENRVMDAGKLSAPLITAPFKGVNWLMDRMVPGYRGMKTIIRDSIDAGPKLAQRIDSKKLETYNTEFHARELKDFETRMQSKMRREKQPSTLKQIRERYKTENSLPDALWKKITEKTDSFKTPLLTRLTNNMRSLGERSGLKSAVDSMRNFFRERREYADFKADLRLAKKLTSRAIKEAEAAARARGRVATQAELIKKFETILQRERSRLPTEQLSNRLNLIKNNVLINGKFPSIRELNSRFAEMRISKLKEVKTRKQSHGSTVEASTTQPVEITRSPSTAVETVTPKPTTPLSRIESLRQQIELMPEGGLLSRITGRRKYRTKETARQELKQAELKQNGITALKEKRTTLKHERIEKTKKQTELEQRLNEAKNELQKEQGALNKAQKSKTTDMAGDATGTMKDTINTLTREIQKIEAEIVNTRASRKQLNKKTPEINAEIRDLRTSIEQHLAEAQSLSGRYKPQRPRSAPQVKSRIEGLAEQRMDAARGAAEAANYLVNPYAAPGWVLRQVGELFSEGRLRTSMEGLGSFAQNPVRFIAEHIKNEWKDVPGIQSVNSILDRAFSLSARIVGTPEWTNLLQATGLRTSSFEALGFRQFKLPDNRTAYLTAQEVTQYESLGEFIASTEERLQFLETSGAVLRNESAIEIKRVGLMGQTEDVLQKGPESFLDKLMAIIKAFQEDGLTAFTKIGEILGGKTVQQFKDEVGEVATANNTALRNNDRVLVGEGGILLTYVHQRGTDPNLAGSEVFIVRKNNFRGLRITEPEGARSDNRTIIIGESEYQIRDSIHENTGWPSVNVGENKTMSLISLLRREHAKVASEDMTKPPIHEEVIGDQKLLGITLGTEYVEIMEGALQGLKKENFVMDNGKLGLKANNLNDGRFLEVTINNGNLMIENANLFVYLRENLTQATPPSATPPPTT